MISIQYTLEGQDVINRDLMNMATLLTDFTIPLTQSKNYLRRDINNAFETEGNNYDFGGWAKLSPNYAFWKSKRFSGGILERSGKMRNSFYDVVTSTMAEIGNTTDYFKYHQSNQPRTKIPRRIMLYFNQETRNEITKAFQDYLKWTK